MRFHLFFRENITSHEKKQSILPRDALGIALLYLGYSVNTTDEAEIQEAYQLIADAVKNGVYQGKVMDEVFQKMEGGNAAIATYYAGQGSGLTAAPPAGSFFSRKEGGGKSVRKSATDMKMRIRTQGQEGSTSG